MGWSRKQARQRLTQLMGAGEELGGPELEVRLMASASEECL